MIEHATKSAKGNISAISMCPGQLVSSLWGHVELGVCLDMVLLCTCVCISALLMKKRMTTAEVGTMEKNLEIVLTNR